MADISVNVPKNVYQTVNSAKSDRDISKGDLKKIEKGMAADGQITADEAKLLDALKNYSEVTIRSGNSLPAISLFDEQIDVHYQGHEVSNVAVGKVFVQGGELQNLPDYVPPQQAGRQSNAYDGKTYGSMEEADQAFERGKTRMLDVNHWGETADTVKGADFKLYDANGNPVDRPARKGDYIRIDLPGPSGYDWVQIEDVQDRGSEFAITVRPSKDPTSDSDEIDHWYTADATNTFVLTKGQTADGKPVVGMGVHGRNEIVNAKETTWSHLNPSKVMKNMKEFGADTLGMQQNQWDSLASGILKP